MKKAVRKEDIGRVRDQFAVVLAQINSKIDLVVEGHQTLNTKIDREVGSIS